MKLTLQIATLSMVLASPSAFAKSELETLRSLCQEQKRQINELEEANERLRDDRHESHPAPARTEASSQATAVTKPIAKPANAQSSYTVKAGDSFDKIARKVGSNPEKLAKTNGLKTSAIIHPGQTLKIPGKLTTSAAHPTPAVATTTASPPETSGQTHEVQTGETLFSISKKHGMSTEALAAANPKVKPSSLRPGQVVSLGGNAPATTMISAPTHAKTPPAVEKSVTATPAPVTESRSTSETLPASITAPPETELAPVTAKLPAAETASLSPTTETKIHLATSDGEITYGEFATKHGTNAQRLNELNGLDLTTATVLARGSKLLVPAQP